MLWLTDLHFDKKTMEEKKTLLHSVQTYQGTCICITGDIGEKETTIECLNLLSENTKKPIYFVLGNHDYFGSYCLDFKKEITEKVSGCVYLSENAPLSIGEKVALIGIDNWNVLPEETSFMRPPDFDAICNLEELSLEEICLFFRKQTKTNIKELKEKLDQAFLFAEIVYVAMHVPPYPIECYYTQVECQSEWAPFWSSAPIGEFLNHYMKDLTEKHLVILSGHTHLPRAYRPKPNIHSLIGKPGAHFLLDLSQNPGEAFQELFLQAPQPH